MSSRGTIDIFYARQFQEKCIELCMPLYQVLMNLTKAFDNKAEAFLLIMHQSF